MGQKISSLGDVFSWKNGESTRNGESSKNGESSRNSEASVASNDGRSVATDGISVSSNKAPERQPFENIYVASATDPQPSSSSQLLSSQDVICPEHPKCCSALTLVANDNAATDTTETITKNIQNSSKSTSGSKKLNHWVLRFNCSRPKSKSTKCCTTPPESVPETNEVKCVCTRYQRTDDHQPSTDIILDNAQAVEEEQSDDDELMPPQNDTLDFVEGFESYHPFEDENDFILPSFHHMPITLNTDMIEEEYINEDFEDRAYRERAKEIQEGIDPPPGFRPSVIQLLELGWPKRRMESLTPVFNCRAAVSTIAVNDMDDNQIVHTSIDYIHYLVPDLLQITNCSFYWGKMDRYEAEKLLENRPEGTFLLRDSAQEEYLFSVSFRKYGRSLHARIEQWNHLFSFDSRDPGVYASSTVCGLIEHYKDPSCCMFFEPMLTIPFPRKFPFSLQHTCRATICSQISYDDVNQLKLPKLLKSYLKEYHYKQRVRIRQFDLEN